MDLLVFAFQSFSHGPKRLTFYVWVLWATEKWEDPSPFQVSQVLPFGRTTASCPKEHWHCFVSMYFFLFEFLETNLPQQRASVLFCLFPVQASSNQLENHEDPSLEQRGFVELCLSALRQGPLWNAEQPRIAAVLVSLPLGSNFRPAVSSLLHLPQPSPELFTRFSWFCGGGSIEPTVSFHFEQGI